MQNLIPLPASVKPEPGTFRLNEGAAIHFTPTTDEVQAVAAALAGHLQSAAGFDLPVAASGGDAPGGFLLALTEADPDLGEEGYRLQVGTQQVTLSAAHPAGLFRGLQTVRQLLPPGSGPLQMDCGLIRDVPRFPWRGVMLDVARHFFGVQAVQRLIDQMVLYKFNVLHLHLSDDQGWRLMIESWPRLAEHGGSTATYGDPGGYYTQDDYRALVEYARARHVIIVPEVDMPGHTHAALASYAELNESGLAPDLYTGREVGFSTFAIRKEVTYRFLEQVLGEIADLTPWPYLHIGGDEAHSTPDPDYKYFVERVQKIVQALGKVNVGWEEVAKANLLPDTIVQYWWNREWAQKAVASGNKLIISPATNTYMDIRYDAATRLGQDWTKKYIEVQDAYDWDPAAILEGAGEESILGIEAPLWTETIVTLEDMDSMFFPRLCAVAEVGWSPRETRRWEDFRRRLAAHGPRLEALGIRFYRSPQVEWPAPS